MGCILVTAALNILCVFCIHFLDCDQIQIEFSIIMELFMQWYIYYPVPLTTLSVTSLSQVLPGYKHNKPTHSWQFLKISTTSPFLLHLQPFNKFVYCFTREDETKDCFYANVPPRAPQLVVHWENQITIWFSSTPTLHPLFSCNLMDFEEVVLGG